MQRKNLIIDEILLKEVKKALDADTESEAVNMSLREVLRSMKVKDLMHFLGEGVWEGDLSEMREDKSLSKKKKGRV